MSELIGMDYSRKDIDDYIGNSVTRIEKHERGYIIITFCDGKGLTVDPDNLFDENGMRLITEHVQYR